MESAVVNTPRVCPNCSSPYTEQQDFCGRCGQKLRLPRLTTRMLLRELWNTMTNLERGFFFTLRELWLRPGETLRHYWDGARVNYYPPLRFVFLIVAASTALMLVSGFYDKVVTDAQQGIYEGFNNEGQDPQVAEMQAKFQQQVKKYTHVLALLMMPFIAFFTRLFFRKHGRNFAEHLIAVSYFTAAITAISIFSYAFFLFFPEQLGYLIPFSLLVTFGFFTYAFKHTFKIGWWSAFWRSVLSYLLGYFGFMILGMIVGIVVALGYLITQNATGGGW